MYTSKAIHRGKFISTNMYQIRRIVSVDELKITKASLTQKRQKGESKEDEKKKINQHQRRINATRACFLEIDNFTLVALTPILSWII
jgi:hypothetical protein